MTGREMVFTEDSTSPAPYLKIATFQQQETCHGADLKQRTLMTLELALL